MPNPNRLRPWLLSLLSGVLLNLIFPRWDLEILAWVALVPLFFAIQNQSLTRSALLGFTTGMVFYLGGLSWINNTLVNYGGIPLAVSWLLLGLLSIYLSFYLALFVYLSCRWSRGNPLWFCLLAPVIWTSLEYLRSTDDVFGFSWLGLGYSQFLSLPVIQIASFTGIYGISALIVLVNAAIFFVISAWVAPQPDRFAKGEAIRLAVVAGGLLVLCLAFGVKTVAQKRSLAKETPPVTVGLVQGNIAQLMKWDPQFQNEVSEIYKELTLSVGQSKPDLIVWPEAATPYFFNQEAEQTASLKSVVQTVATPTLVGSPYRQREGDRVRTYNRAWLVSGKGEDTAHYDKIHLVPFGEFVPFREYLVFVEKLVAIVGEFGRGQSHTVFPLGDNRFGVSICYEITFPDLVRHPVKNGATFLVNITNDAWFGRSAASYQHMAMGALRAVENGVPIVRSANTGISGTIEATGEIRDATALFVRTTVLTDIHPQPSSPTFYARYGDIFSFFCLASTLLLAFWIRNQNHN